MDKLDVDEIQKLAHNLMFSLTQVEAEAIAAEFSVLLKQLELLDKIDTSEVAEMIYPFADETSFMRPDEVNHVLSQDEALANAPKKEGPYFVIPKVVSE